MNLPISSVVAPTLIAAAPRSKTSLANYKINLINILLHEYFYIH